MGNLGTLNIGRAEARINRGIALGLAIGVLIAGYGCGGDHGERGGAAGGADLPEEIVELRRIVGR